MWKASLLTEHKRLTQDLYYLMVIGNRIFINNSTITTWSS